ncbi:hypothetical protein DNTS_004511, partial [Danionella cerebrum]
CTSSSSIEEWCLIRYGLDESRGISLKNQDHASSGKLVSIKLRLKRVQRELLEVYPRTVEFAEGKQILLRQLSGRQPLYTMPDDFAPIPPPLKCQNILPPQTIALNQVDRQKQYVKTTPFLA